MRQCLSRAAWWLLGVLVSIVGGIALAALLWYIKEDKLSTKTKRLLIHIPFGLILVLGASLNWVLPVIAASLFIFYERNEDHWLKDQAWKDVAGALYGMGLGILVWAVLGLL